MTLIHCGPRKTPKKWPPDPCTLSWIVGPLWTVVKTVTTYDFGASSRIPGVIDIPDEDEDDFTEQDDQTDGGIRSNLAAHDDGSDARGPPPRYSLGAPKMVKVYRATPPSALPKFSGPCYVLTVAQKPGLVTTM